MTNPDPRHRFYLALTRDGMGARHAARTLKIPWWTAQRWLRSLVLAEWVRPVGGKRAPRGAIQFWEPGPRAGQGEWFKVVQGSVAGAAHVHHSTDKARSAPQATLPVRLHRGRVSVPIRQAPMNLGQLAGCYTSRLVNGVQNHWFEHRDEAGERWTMQVSEPKDRRRGLVVQVSPPAVTTTDPVLVATAAEPNGWWKKRARKEAHRWADLVGIELFPNPDEARVTQPIEGGIQVGKEVPKVGQAGVDVDWVDGSPPNGRELESANLDRVVGLMRLPGDVAALRRDFEAMGALLADQVAAVKDLSRLVKGQLAFNTEVVRVQASQAEQLARAAAPSLPPSGDGYT